MLTELRKSRNNQILEEARNHQKSLCPRCSKQGWYVIETRPTSNKGIGKKIRRRRRRCSDCGFRDTTYEIPDFMYRQMLKDRKTVEDIAKAEDFSKTSTTNGKPAFKTPTVEESFVDCDNCRFNTGSSCSFGLADYQTFDARDCVNFQKGD